MPVNVALNEAEDREIRSKTVKDTFVNRNNNTTNTYIIIIINLFMSTTRQRHEITKPTILSHINPPNSCRYYKCVQNTNGTFELSKDRNGGLCEVHCVVISYIITLF